MAELTVPSEPVANEAAECRTCQCEMRQIVDGGPWEATDATRQASAGEHEHVPVRASWAQQWRDLFGRDPVEAVVALVDEYAVERAFEVMAAVEGRKTQADSAAARARAVRAQLVELLSDPRTLRQAADEIRAAALSATDQTADGAAIKGVSHLDDR